jgi:hypothetical protein
MRLPLFGRAPPGEYRIRRAGRQLSPAQRTAPPPAGPPGGCGRKGKPVPMQTLGSKLGRIVIPLATPFREDAQDIDFDAAAALADHVVSRKLCDSVIVRGRRANSTP